MVAPILHTSYDRVKEAEVTPEEAVAEYESYVWKEAHRLGGRLLWFVPMDVEDLAGHGFIGLMKAVQTVDETRDAPERAYYIRRKVWGEMMSAIRRFNPGRLKCAHVQQVDDEEGLILEHTADVDRQSEIEAVIDVRRMGERMGSQLTPVQEYAVRRALNGDRPFEFAAELGYTGIHTSRVLREAKDVLSARNV